jgi:cyclopropane-fatty-acyl-phospholipid synthase
MGFLSLEHGRTAYRADFVLQAAVVAGLTLLLLFRSPVDMAADLLVWVGLGVFAWTLIEYGLHRFVLHGLPPFRRWHAAHHQRPAALIGLPIPASAALFAALVFAPAWWAAGRWVATALTLGVLIGYLAYTVTHHATHHAGLGRGAWWQRRRRWHALHHRHADRAVCFGVTTGFWDRLFGTRLDAAAPVNAGDTRGSR